MFKDINYILCCKIAGDMRSTPYTVNGKQEEYSAKRTSKIKYLSERTHQLIARLSQRLDLGLGFNLYNPKYRYWSSFFLTIIKLLNCRQAYK